MDYRQQLRGQFAPPPPGARVHTTGVLTGSISPPVSRAGSDLIIQPPNYIPHSRIPHDGVVHSSLSPSSQPEIRVQAGHEARDADIDPPLQAVSNARAQATSQSPVSTLPSLPSLKASGLLEWPRPGSAGAGVAPSNIQPSSNWQPPTQHFTPSRQPQRDSVRLLSAQSPPDGSRPPAPSAPSGMPVGLQWLAHESSMSRPS